MNRRFSACAIAAAMFAIGPVTNAQIVQSNISEVPGDSSALGYTWVGTLNGEITESSLQVLKELPRIKAGEKILLLLNSEGGDWSSAMAIGRLLRSTRSAAWVFEGRCLSSCVMILAGAAERSVGEGSRIGIHRPYWTSNAQLSQEESTEKYRVLENQTKTYLHEMNIPVALFDAMVRIPASDVRFLSKDEISQYGLGDLDPVEAEMRDAEFARTLGISRTEYLARRQIGERLCRTPENLASLSEERRISEIENQLACFQRVLRTGR